MSQHASVTRTGAWTVPEEAYGRALAEAFRAGLLRGVAPGTSMRAYVAAQLGCTGMRVSKKRVCRRWGKCTFAQSPKRSAPAVAAAERRLLALRRACQRSVRGGRARLRRAPGAEAPGLMLLSLRRLPFTMEMPDADAPGGGRYTLDAFAFEGENLFQNGADIFVELRPPAVWCSAAQSGAVAGLPHRDAVAFCGACIASGRCHAVVDAPRDTAGAPRGWGVSVITRGLHRSLRRLLGAGGVSPLTPVWVAVSACTDTPGTGAVSPVPVLPRHRYRRMPHPCQ